MDRRGFLKALGIVPVAAVIPDVVSSIAPDPVPSVEGVTGKALCDAGFVYAPYVPMMMTPAFEDFQEWYNNHTHPTLPGPTEPPKALNPDFYGEVRIA